jgi:flavodoxin I
MKVLVVYDSVYGNTEKIAKAIGGAIDAEVRVIRASEADPTGLGPINALIVGSPTQGGRATQPIRDFLAKVPAAALKGVKVAAFDTRYAGRFVKVFGFAADKIASSLEAKEGSLISPPAAFFVTGKKGPLKEGELERAASWAKEITK